MTDAEIGISLIFERVFFCENANGYFVEHFVKWHHLSTPLNIMECLSS